jgi:transcriptional regulator with XRE-family HTH domain
MTSIAKKIRDLRTLLALDQTEFGKKLDPKNPVPQATISKWERDKQQPDAENTVRLARLAGVPPHQWLGIPGIGEVEVERGKRVPIIGAVAAGEWREAVAYPDDEQEWVEAQLPASYRNLDIQAFDVSGPSMNRVYPDGTLAFIASTQSFRGPENGDRVLVIRHNRTGLVEATLKEYVIDDAGKKWLWPRSYDPMHQAPIDPSDKAEGDVVVSGVVVAALVLEKGRMLPTPKKAARKK